MADPLRSFRSGSATGWTSRVAVRGDSQHDRYRNTGADTRAVEYGCSSGLSGVVLRRGQRVANGRVDQSATGSGADGVSPSGTVTVMKEEAVGIGLARRAAELRRRARRGSAVDALVVAVAEPDGAVLTGDEADITALAAVSHGVTVELV